MQVAHLSRELRDQLYVYALVGHTNRLSRHPTHTILFLRN
jgi:hypothetical protein